MTINSGSGSSTASTTLFVGKRDYYGISRILMCFPGVDFSTLEGAVIESAQVSLRDLFCEGTVHTVQCYLYEGTA